MPAHDPDVQMMAPAPWLPPAQSEDEAAPGPLRTVAPRPRRPVTAPAPQMAQTASVGPEAAAAYHAPVSQPAAPYAPAGHSPLGRILAGVAEQQARLASLHQQFLADQGEIHRQFLEMQTRVGGRIRNQFHGGGELAYELAPAPAGAGYDYGAPALEAAAPAADYGQPAEAVFNGYTTPTPATPEIPLSPEVPAAQVAAAPAAAPAPVAAPARETQAPAAPAEAKATAARPAAPAIPPAPVRPGPKFDRGQIDSYASGRLGALPGLTPAAGARAAARPRLPASMLLIDRVTGLEVDASGRAATLWTELDVQEGAWYMGDEGRVPPGLVLEGAQGYVLLLDALGVDPELGRGRSFQHLSMDVIFHESLPRGEDPMRYELRMEGPSTESGTPVFAWQGEALAGTTPKLTIRNGRIGLVEGASGSSWDPETATPTPDARLDAPDALCEKTSFSPEDVRAFAEGRAGDAFGPAFRMAHAHSRSPASPRGDLQIIHSVPVFDREGGPWKRGYLRAETPLTPESRLFTGHLEGDRAMPASLMLEGGLQALELYLAALGYTIERDGWRFEPVLDQVIELRWQGRVTPQDKLLAWEIFIDAVEGGPLPVVHAAIRLTVDGRPVFHVPRVGVRLALEHPLEHWRRLGPHKEQETATPVPLRDLGGLVGYDDPRALRLPEGFVLDYASMVSGSWGRPDDTYGKLYEGISGLRKMPRGPAPPYQFLTRVVSLDGPLGQMKPGLTVELEYDVPEKVWYFDVNGYPTMPWCVFMEIVLQGCGWLAIGLGTFWGSDTDLMFRNLDGTGTLTREILPTSGTLRAKVKVTNISRSAGIEIQSFETSCYLGDECVYTMDTVFGFFPKEAFENQVGLPVNAEQKARIAGEPNQVIDLTSAPPKYCDGSLRLAGPLLRMLDRIWGWWPEGGKKGLGYVRGEKDINPGEWFFKAHFFRDPVQPGSLGHEAFVQLLQWAMIEKGMGEGIPNARFEPIMLGRKLWWRYRGQITPKNLKITTELEITEVGRDEKGPYAVGDAWLWVDGKCIYQAKNLGMRIVEGEAPVRKLGPATVEKVLDPEVDPWIKDHCPTWTMPSLPAMSMVDLLAQAAEGHTGLKSSSLSSVQVRRWLPFPKGAVPIKTEVTGSGDTLDATLYAWREASNPAMSRFEPVASGKVTVGQDPGPRPEPWAPLADAEPAPSPYGDYLFHGPAFQMLETLRIGPTGSSAILRPEKGAVEFGALNQGLLDAATHAIPHGHLERWSANIDPGQVGYPYRIPFMHLYEPLPTEGEVRVEVRFAGFDGDVRTPKMDIQMIASGRVVLAMQLVEVLLPQGRLMRSTADQRLGFLVDRRYIHDLSLSEFDGPVTRLKGSEVSLMDWIPGNVAWAYGIPREQRVDLTAQVAIREHISHRAKVHPMQVVVDDDLGGGYSMDRPLRHYPVTLVRNGADIEVHEAGPPEQSYDPVRNYWKAWHGLEVCPPEDIYQALARFLGDVVIVDPEALAKVKGRSCLYLANHQVGLESLLFAIVSQAFTEVPTVPLAKAEHKTSYLQWMWAHSGTYPGVREPHSMIFFEREDLASLLEILDQLHGDLESNSKSILVHVEGTRSLTCRKPVATMSSGFIDLALKANVPIVPVRFIGGLPVDPLEKRIEFPVNYGKQEYWIGKPILPEDLKKLRYKERKQLVLDAINLMGVRNEEEVPLSPDPQFGEEVRAWMEKTGATHEFATLFVALSRLPAPEAEVRAVLEGARAGKLVVDDSIIGRWIEALARKVYGDRGPQIVKV